MHFPVQYVDTVTSDRIREAEAARRSQGIGEAPVRKPRRPRRLLALARIAFSAIR